VGTVLASIEDRQIQVSGHTDNTPISDKLKSQFPTNWELSVARATNVVRFLQDKAKLPPERMVASGYGEYQPIAKQSNFRRACEESSHRAFADAGAGAQADLEGRAEGEARVGKEARAGKEAQAPQEAPLTFRF
jgi:hypothetical protein